MRHRKKGRTLDRKAGARRALLAGLARSFVLYGRIRTTRAKAKAVQPLVERCVTTARTPSLASRRKLLAFFGGEERLAKKLLEEIGPVFRSRPGGYTRLTRLPARRGDAAPMALLEWVTEAL